jgi:uncharacterized protein YdhG (YjbR/CyaY superfamily)
MDAAATKFKTVDEYLSTFPSSTKKMLQQLRETIRKAAPQAEEVISYNMPAYKQQGMLVYFAGYKGHIGFYPVSSAIKEFEEELSAFERSKGTVRFPLDKPLPLKLITRMVKYRIQENKTLAELKAAKKKK